MEMSVLFCNLNEGGLTVEKGASFNSLCINYIFKYEVNIIQLSKEKKN